MDPAADALPRGEDLIEPDEAVDGRHPAEYASRWCAWTAAPCLVGEPRPREMPEDRHLRVCASSDIMSLMLDSPIAPKSSEFDRQRYAAVGRALADPKRLCVLESLSAGELSVSDLSTKVGCQVPNMSQHLAVLGSAGLVQSRRDGSTVFYRLADVRVLEAYRLIQSLAGQGA
jgi:DNA-binding transcriptional ArsR family regulator